MRTREGSRGLQLKQGVFVSTATPLTLYKGAVQVLNALGVTWISPDQVSTGGFEIVKNLLILTQFRKSSLQYQGTIRSYMQQLLSRIIIWYILLRPVLDDVTVYESFVVSH